MLCARTCAPENSSSGGIKGGPCQTRVSRASTARPHRRAWLSRRLLDRLQLRFTALGRGMCSVLLRSRVDARRPERFSLLASKTSQRRVSTVANTAVDFVAKCKSSYCESVTRSSTFSAVMLTSNSYSLQKRVVAVIAYNIRISCRITRSTRM